jgi:acetyltransferase
MGEGAMIPVSADRVRTNAPPRCPAHLVESRRLPDGTHVVIRPIHPDDDALERAFIDGLSSEARYNRLLGARKLTPEEVRHLTRIDYGCEMAYVAVSVSGRQAVQLGVARYARDTEGAGAEFAVVVADAWQRKGVGTLLLGALLAHARAAGIARLHGIRLATNQAMHALARKLGFAQIIDPQDATVRQVAKILTPAIAAANACLDDRHHAAAANDENPGAPPPEA